MEITSFYPLIMTSDFEATKASYEALGFKVAHTISNPDDKLKDKNKTIVMKNDKEFRLAIVYTPELTPGVNSVPNSAIWMNVRDFDATISSLKEHGFTAYGTEREYEFLKFAAMKAPDGHILVVVYHKRKDDWE